MSRKYEKVKDLIPVAMSMLEDGKSYKQIAEELGFQDEKVVSNLLYRARHPKTKPIPKYRGKKPAKTLQEYKYENKRLKMENELLRDFLLLIGKE